MLTDEIRFLLCIISCAILTRCAFWAWQFVTFDSGDYSSVGLIMLYLIAVTGALFFIYPLGKQTDPVMAYYADANRIYQNNERLVRDAARARKQDAIYVLAKNLWKEKNKS